MKYKTIGIIIFFGIILGIGTYFFIERGNPTEVEVKVSTGDEVIKRFSQKDSFVLVIGDSTCSGCQAYKASTLTEYVKKYGQSDLVLIYADTSFPNRTDFSEFKIDYDLTDYELSPTTYYIKAGKYVSGTNTKKEDVLTLAQLEAFIQENRASD